MEKIAKLFSGHKNMPGSKLSTGSNIKSEEIPYNYGIIDKVCGPSSWTVNIYKTEDDRIIFGKKYVNEYNPEIGVHGAIFYYDMETGDLIKKEKLEKHTPFY